MRNSAELAEALHQGLALEAASPLDYEVTNQLQGHVYQSGYRVEIKDGQHVMWDIRKSPLEYILLIPVSENHFSAELFGNPAEISFSVDHQGHATELFIKMQGSNGFPLPRKDNVAPEQETSVSPATNTPVATTPSGDIIGTYGADGGALSIQEVDGQLAMSNPNPTETEQWPC